LLEKLRDIPGVEDVRVVEDAQGDRAVIVRTRPEVRWFGDDDGYADEFVELIRAVEALGLRVHSDGLFDDFSQEPELWFELQE